ncbi:YggS family pyridoxal phosphate enzyme [Frankia nepalensis]|uniref:Pyridoxal phosphate homeostasis protein n=1 Tax=Frankia nepalensis TaxID=1836974 RepID=A0A937RMY5_9ACTN|nr:alanine racemase [Frankia nepalensis]MBL7628826.1 alanine racemase [Frankia nepalensis]
MTSAADLARLAVNLADVRERIEAAARAAGRDPAELTLVAVSKTWPASDVLGLWALGVTHFAENREQEAAPKVAAVLAALATGPSGGGGPEAGEGTAVAGGPPAGPASPVWHFVGQLQRNKVNAIARWADWVQSVDRPELVASLSRAAVAGGRVLTICVQVCLDSPGGAGAAGRGGVAPGDVGSLTELVANAEGLRLAGVMAVAPRGEPARPAFARLRTVAERLWRDHPDARVISAGMSGDLEDAVAEGATHLRIGTALFGERRPVP